jgi:mRNA interferase RelE/StbE
MPLAYSLRYDRKVLKDLQAIDKSEAKRIVEKIESYLIHNPGADKKLKGTLATFYSYRVGSYRVIYEIEGHTLIVVRISHRRQVYN